MSQLTSFDNPRKPQELTKSNSESDILKKENEDLRSENERLSSENEELKKKLYTTEGRLHEYRRMYGTNDSFTSEVSEDESP